jgi:uroporphyrinogen decarboxylase
MSPILDCIKNKNTTTKPIWLMRQAGRYLPEFKEIRIKNPDFIKLCLNKNLAQEITLQPLKRFKLDAAIIFSDILILPYGLNQDVKFIKNFGPMLGDLNIKNLNKINSVEFSNKLRPVYETLKKISKNKLIKEKDLIGFIGAPWTILVYMMNKKSPKKNLSKDFLKDKFIIDQLLIIIEKFLKIHIYNQIQNGATIIQIFDSWAGLLEEKDLNKYIYEPTLRIVNYVKSLNVPVICFPRGIKNYRRYCEVVNPDVINIDYEVDPKKIREEINITIQGGLNPKILLTDQENLKKQALKYLDIFKEHPYIFNLGHGVLPETDPNMIGYLVNLVKDY